MNNRLLIRLHTPALDEQSMLEWLLFDHALTVVARGCHALGELYAALPDPAAELQITVLLPLDSALLCQVAIPSRQQRHIKQALPYMVEELIAEEIENVHLAMPQPLDASKGIIDVAVVRHRLLIDWLDQLHRHRLSPSCFALDALSIPREPDAWAILIDRQRILLRHGAYAALAVELDDVAMVVAALVQAQPSLSPDKLQRIALISCADNAQDQQCAEAVLAQLREVLPTAELQHCHYEEPVTELLGVTALHEAASVLNLLQGGYAVGGGDRPAIAVWKAPLLTIAAGVVLFALLNIGAGWFFSSQAAEMEQSALALYRDIFPQERRVLSPKKQMESKLRAAGQSGGDAQFLAMMAQTAQSFAESPQRQRLRITQLKFDRDNRELQIELRAPSITELEAFKQQLADAGLAAELNSASEQSDHYSGRLRVRTL